MIQFYYFIHCVICIQTYHWMKITKANIIYCRPTVRLIYINRWNWVREVIHQSSDQMIKSVCDFILVFFYYFLLMNIINFHSLMQIFVIHSIQKRFFFYYYILSFFCLTHSFDFIFMTTRVSIAVMIFLIEQLN